MAVSMSVGPNLAEESLKEKEWKTIKSEVQVELHLRTYGVSKEDKFLFDTSWTYLWAQTSPYKNAVAGQNSINAYVYI